MKSPKISVIISNYNSEKFISQTIKCLLNQTFQDFEIIVVDDESSDSSIEIIKSFAEKDHRIKIIEQEHTGSLAGALNTGYKEARGEYFCQVDADDIIRQDCLEKSYKFINKNNPDGMIYTDHTIINKDGKHLGAGNRCRLPYSKDEILLNFMTFHFRLFHRGVFEKVGGYDELFKRVEDYDFCLKVSENFEIQKLDEVLYYYRLHGGQITQKQSLDIVKYSYIAINNAMKRRGLDKEYRLICKKVKKAGIIAGNFGLMKKGTVFITQF